MTIMQRMVPLFAILFAWALPAQDTQPDFIWWEGEDAKSHTLPASNAFNPRNDKEKDVLSGGAWLQTDKAAGATAEWEVTVPAAGTYHLWVRKFWFHGPFSWSFNDQPARSTGKKPILADSVDISRYVCANWVDLGEVALPAGMNKLKLVADADATAFGIDCWLLTQDAFQPNGRNKPGEKYRRTEPGWFAFEPDRDDFSKEALLDLRRLNQEYAGIDGPLTARGDHFAFAKSGAPVKFWAVNTLVPSTDKEAVYLARFLAKRGVNMVRLHTPVVDKSNPDPRQVDMKYLDRIHFFVNELKKQGVYTKLSFYFPLWFTINAKWELPGYGDQHKKEEFFRRPYGLLYYHPQVQEIYKAQARTLLQTKNPYSGLSMAEDPAVAMIEAVNEDGFFFWTFSPYKNPTPECMVPLEQFFGAWLGKKYGSIEKAREAWGPDKMPKHPDAPEQGRAAFYENTGVMGNFDWAKKQRNDKRASDQLQFLVETQRDFYQFITGYYKNELGFKGLVSASNWHTVDNGTLGALEKYTYTASDVVDRHGYFGGPHKGDASDWSIQAGNTYEDKSGLLVPDSLSAEILYGDRPHMISEYNYTAPNRFRAEGPFMASTYGSLGGTDAFIHFRVHQSDWCNKEGKFAVMTPTIMGQFPAMAAMYRLGMLQEGPAAAEVTLSLKNLYAFKGTPAEQPQHMDEMRKRDIPQGGVLQEARAQAIDPLAYYVGKVKVEITPDQEGAKLLDLSEYIDRQAKTIKSATGQLFWNWGKGVATVNTPLAQGACGFLKGYGEIKLSDITLNSDNEYGCIVAVALDGKPLKASGKILLQVMTEDQNYHWQTSGSKPMTIVSTGVPPILVKEFAGTVRLEREEPDEMRVLPLDMNGCAKPQIATGNRTVHIPLQKDTVYYMLLR